MQPHSRPSPPPVFDHLQCQSKTRGRESMETRLSQALLQGSFERSKRAWPHLCLHCIYTKRDKHKVTTAHTQFAGCIRRYTLVFILQNQCLPTRNPAWEYRTVYIWIYPLFWCQSHSGSVCKNIQLIYLLLPELQYSGDPGLNPSWISCLLYQDSATI